MKNVYGLAQVSPTYNPLCLSVKVAQSNGTHFLRWFPCKFSSAKTRRLAVFKKAEISYKRSLGFSPSTLIEVHRKQGVFITTIPRWQKAHFGLCPALAQWPELKSLFVCTLLASCTKFTPSLCEEALIESIAYVLNLKFIKGRVEASSCT